MGKKILIVDDEEVIRKFLRIHLSKLGYEVKEATDGAEALKQLGKDDFDLLICDILMPNKDGWQVLKEMRSDPKTKDIPVIVLTAKNEDSDMFKGYDLGANYYMTKPFTKAQLLYGLKLMLGEDWGKSECSLRLSCYSPFVALLPSIERATSLTVLRKSCYVKIIDKLFWICFRSNSILCGFANHESRVPQATNIPSGSSPKDEDNGHKRI